MSFHPPVRPDVKPKQPKEWYAEIMEKDELLLYITATLGVVLPGIVYFIYHKIHKIYMNYALKKQQQRQIDEAARSEVVIIHLSSVNGPTRQLAAELGSILNVEMLNPSKIWAVDEMDVKDFATFKGFCIFLVETVSHGNTPTACEWFLDWLEDVAADSKQKKKTNFEDIRFAIAGFGSSEDGEAKFNKVARTLQKRMKILGSKQIMSLELLDTETNNDIGSPRFESWVESLLDSIDRHLPRVEESHTESEYTDEESDEEIKRDKKKL